jgi:RHS repeat-associated protein
MKTTRILSLAMTMAMGMIAGLQASVTEHRPPAPLPEFKTPEQLAKWRTETTAKTSAQEPPRLTTQDSSTPFYTGKPFLAESGSYAFKYREYNPEMNRWTTVDPSGFPDGANNRVYVNNKILNSFDDNGLDTHNFSDGGAFFTLNYTLSYDYYNSPNIVTYSIGGLTSLSGSVSTPYGNISTGYNLTVNNPSLINTDSLYAYYTGGYNTVTYTGDFAATVILNVPLSLFGLTGTYTKTLPIKSPYNVTAVE